MYESDKKNNNVISVTHIHRHLIGNDIKFIVGININLYLIYYTKIVSNIWKEKDSP